MTGKKQLSETKSTDTDKYFRVNTSYSVPEYYKALTASIINQPKGVLTIHYGLWGPETKTDQQANLRSNHYLVKGCKLTPEWRILDAGCGVGETSIWLAKQFGVKVVGLTICKSHVNLGTEYAGKEGVGHLVEFHHGDFMDLQYPDNSFDAVLSQETYCYTSDKVAFLQGVNRVLKSGGRWQCVDGFLTEKILSESDEVIHDAVQQGWLTEPLQRWQDTLKSLELAGFVNIKEINLEAEVAPSTQKAYNTWKFFRSMFAPSGWAHQKFIEGVLNFHEGLQQGIFTYRLIVGTKPE